LSDRKLMQLFSAFVAWQNFAAVRLTEAEVEEHSAEAALKYQESVFSIARPISEKVTKTRQAAQADEDLQNARQRVDNAYAMRKMSGVMYANCERAALLMSRELSRRIGGGPVQGRNASWNP
jgi:hypothetical protein